MSREIQWSDLLAVIEKDESDIKEYIHYVAALNPTEQVLAELEYMRSRSHAFLTAARDYQESCKKVQNITQYIKNKYDR